MFRMMTSETHDPGELVTRISNRLHDDHGGTPYLTCVVLRIDLDTRRLAYVNAGHPAGIVLDGPELARAAAAGEQRTASRAVAGADV